MKTIRDGESTETRWTRQNGSAIHDVYQDAVQDELEDLDNDIVVDHNVPVIVTKSDGSHAQGYIDTLVEHHGKATVIDYKTHDMSSWTHGDARRFGNEHGRQVQEYVHSEGMPADTKGYIVAVGHPPGDPQIQQTYANTLSLYDVEAKFPSSGEQEAIAKTARQIFSEREGQSKALAEDMIKEGAGQAAELAGGPVAGEVTREAINVATEASQADPQAAAKLSEQVASQAPTSAAKSQEEAYDYSQGYGY